MINLGFQDNEKKEAFYVNSKDITASGETFRNSHISVVEVDEKKDSDYVDPLSIKVELTGATDDNYHQASVMEFMSLQKETTKDLVGRDAKPETTIDVETDDHLSIEANLYTNGERTDGIEDIRSDSDDTGSEVIEQIDSKNANVETASSDDEHDDDVNNDDDVDSDSNSNDDNDGGVDSDSDSNDDNDDDVDSDDDGNVNFGCDDNGDDGNNSI